MKLLALFFAFLMLIGSAAALTGTGDFSIWGTNASNAQLNITRLPGNNQSVNVSGWAVAGGTKNFTVNVTNVSDVVTLTLYNMTAYNVYSLLVNSNPIQAYQANSTGAIKFSRTQLKSNQTYKIQPAVNMAGYNLTWLWVNGSAVNAVNQSLDFRTIVGSGNLTERAKNTLYQNVNSSPLYVSVMFGGGTAGDANFVIDTTNPPHSKCDYQATTVTTSMSCIVPPLYYYQVNHVGTGVQVNWMEIQ